MYLRCVGGVESKTSKALFGTVSSEAKDISSPLLLSVSIYLTQHMSFHTEFKKIQRGQASRVSCLAHRPAERRITCRFPAIDNRLHGYRIYWDIVDHYALTPTRLGLVPNVRVAIPGPPAAIRDQAPGLDVLVPQVLQRLERRQSELGSAAALALLPHMMARCAFAAG